MGLDFRAQLCIQNPDDESPTIVSLPELGNAGIRRAMEPYIELNDEGYIPCMGELPIDEDTEVFGALCTFKSEICQRRLNLSRQLAELAMRHDPDKEWDSTLSDYIEIGAFADALSNTVLAIKSCTSNPTISCRIVWS